MSKGRFTAEITPYANPKWRVAIFDERHNYVMGNVAWTKSGAKSLARKLLARANKGVVRMS